MTPALVVTAIFDSNVRASWHSAANLENGWSAPILRRRKRTCS
jgi:hypothetical protein